jgi:hypothetical protein
VDQCAVVSGNVFPETPALYRYRQKSSKIVQPEEPVSIFWKSGQLNFIFGIFVGVYCFMSARLNKSISKDDDLVAKFML